MLEVLREACVDLGVPVETEISVDQAAQAAAARQDAISSVNQADAIENDRRCKRANAAKALSDKDHTDAATALLGFEKALEDDNPKACEWVATQLSALLDQRAAPQWTVSIIRECRDQAFEVWKEKRRVAATAKRLYDEEARVLELFQRYHAIVVEANQRMDSASAVPVAVQFSALALVRSAIGRTREVRFEGVDMAALERLILGGDNAIVAVLQCDRDLAAQVANAGDRKRATALLIGLRNAVYSRIRRMESETEARQRQEKERKDSARRARQLARATASANPPSGKKKGGKKSR